MSWDGVTLGGQWTLDCYVPIAQAVEIDRDLDEFNNGIREIPIKKLAGGFKEFVYLFLRILSKLTSNILINDYNNRLNI